MQTYLDLKNKKSEKYNKLIDDSKIFFAFSNDRFKEKVDKLGEKVVDIGAGGFCPSSKVKEFSSGIKNIEAWHKKTMAELKEKEAFKNKAIAYELNNHECYYTGEIEDVVEFFKGVYTLEDIKKVYKKNVDKFDY